MKSRIVLSLLAIATLTSTFLISCEPPQPTTKELAEQKRQEVIAAHDSAMAKMNNKAVKTLSLLKSERDEFMLDSSSHHHAHLQECNKAIQDLEAAQENMMQWMRDFSKAKEVQRTDEEKVKFYDEEMAKIQKVDEQLTKSIKEGSHFFHNWLLDKADKDKEKEMKEKEEAYKHWEEEHHILPDDNKNANDNDGDVQV